ncbi:MAG: hypothetical protein K6G65_03425 [Lachnospiraceae bacterium]|nr:hypothetical protein [Lachnospiraceae bacterium]
MRSNEELMKGILHKKAVYKARKQAQRLAVASAGLAVLLVLMLFNAPGITGNIKQHTATVMGSTILGPEMGGYVIIAILAFTLGSVVTLLIQKLRQTGME